MPEKVGNQFDLFYRSQGDPQGLPILFIHAFPLNHEMWKPQEKALPQKYRALVYDIRGLGKSPLRDAQFTLESFVEDLITLMDHLTLPQAILCGLSLGGYIALRAVEKYPERVRGLVLCDTRSEADNNESKLKRAQSIQLLKTQGVKAFAEGFIPDLISSTTQKERPEVIRRLKEMILSQSAEGISAAQLALMSRTDTTESLAKIRVPTLILVGEEDRITPPSHSQAMYQKIRGSSFQILPQAGHLSNLENPDLFNRAFFDFLEDF